jgi:SAM-dependent methyltransferase
MSTETPWQIKMFNKSLKKQQKINGLRPHFHDLNGKRCLLVTCGDNNGAMNYRIREWGGTWVWGELEEGNIGEIEALLGEPVVKIDKSTLKFPFPDGAFDAVLTIDCHEHLEDPLPLNHELYRVTKPGGTVVVTVPNGNERKLAVRIKHLVGMTKKDYGHVVVGYDIPELSAMLEKAGLRPYATGSYSKFFTEMLELVINFAYVKVLSKKSKVKVDEGVIAPTSRDQLKSVEKSYRIYSLIYPFFWVISQLDRLLFFVRGHAVIVEAKR